MCGCASSSLHGFIKSVFIIGQKLRMKNMNEIFEHYIRAVGGELKKEQSAGFSFHPAISIDVFVLKSIKLGVMSRSVFKRFIAGEPARRDPVIGVLSLVEHRFYRS